MYQYAKRQGAILDILANQGILTGRFIADEEIRQIAIAEAEQARLLADAGIKPKGVASSLSEARQVVGDTLIRVGRHLQGSYAAAQAAPLGPSTEACLSAGD